MALTVPPPQVAHIRKFLEVPDDKVGVFLDALAKAGPQFNIADLSSEVSDHVGLPKALTTGIVGVLGSLYVTKDAQNIPVETFVDQEVAVALRNAGTFSKENADVEWARLRKFLVAALALERTLGTAAKAGHILTQHERIFSTARILTDVRPIFHSNVSEKPESALIIHMLRVTQRDPQHNFEDLFFALDSNDVRALKTVIDRALKKEETLKALMKGAGVAVLDPKETY